MSNNPIQNLVDLFNLLPHPEGGYYSETYRSKGVLSQAALPAHYNGDRNFGTAIYFLLTRGNFSAFHKIKQDETWHFYAGDALLVHMISPEGHYSVVKIGSAYSDGEVPQFTVPGGYWFASECAPESNYSFVGCTVYPGFDFDDFVLANSQQLAQLFPQHRTIIERLTR